MLSFDILIPAILNGIMTGAVYALIALGLTLIYGVLHIINFAHGALLTAALFAVYFAHQLLGLDPYVAVFAIAPVFFVLGYALQRFIIGPASHGEDRNILLVTLGIAVVLQNLLLYAFHADTRTIDVPSGFKVLDIGVALLPVSRVVGVGAVTGGASVVALASAAMLTVGKLSRAPVSVASERDRKLFLLIRRSVAQEVVEEQAARRFCFGRVVGRTGARAADRLGGRARA